MEKFNFTTTEYANHVLDKANEILDKCRIYGDASERHGLRENIENSIAAKSSLWEIFKNSPFHNGKGQLIIPMEIDRPCDEQIIEEYAQYIKDIAYKYFLVDERIEGYNHEEASSKRYNLERLIRAVNYMSLSDNDVVIKGKPFGEYRDEYRKLEEIEDRFEEECYCTYGKYVSYENKRKYDKVYNLANAISRCIGHLLEDEDDIAYLSENFPRSQCRKGIKISRVVQKCLKEIGLYDLAITNEREVFNKKYSHWTDAVSPMKIKKWSVLSINYVDYLTMSHGSNWTSCLNTDKDNVFSSGCYGDGFNSRRTLDYALDSTTMVFYTVDESYDGDDFELQPKQTRQLFHFGEGKLIQARLYPQGETSRRSIYTQYRENVEYLLANAMGEANLWSAPERGMLSVGGGIVDIGYEYHSGNYIDFLRSACHGGEERDFQSEVNYVILRGSNGNEDNGKPVIIGSRDAVCIMCGERMSESYAEAISCEDCYAERNY